MALHSRDRASPLPHHKTEGLTPEKRRRVEIRVDGSEEAKDMHAYLTLFCSGERPNGSTQKPDKDRNLVARLRAVAEGKVGLRDSCSDVYDLLCAYDVTRNFKGLRKDSIDELGKLVEHLRLRWPWLQPLIDGDDARAVVKEVELLEKVCKDHWGSANTCASSKLLCMLGLRVPIYDSLGREALFGSKQSRPYAQFIEKWAADYAPRRAAYLAAAIAAGAGVDGEGAHLEWFCARAYDRRLMRIGKKGK